MRGGVLSSALDIHARHTNVVSLLTGRAQEWGTAVWNANAGCLARYSLFKEEMLQVFDRSAHRAEASRLLSALRQGGRSAADYSIEFRTLATSCDWNEPALVARFLEGLNADIKDEVLACETAASISFQGPLPLVVTYTPCLRLNARLSRGIFLTL